MFICLPKPQLLRIFETQQFNTYENNITGNCTTHHLVITR